MLIPTTAGGGAAAREMMTPLLMVSSALLLLLARTLTTRSIELRHPKGSREGEGRGACGRRSRSANDARYVEERGDSSSAPLSSARSLSVRSNDGR